MVFTGAILLAALAAINRCIAGSWLYPPALYSAYWSGLLFALYASGDAFYPISLTTVMLLFLGKLAFSLGGLLVLFSLGRRSWSRLPNPDPRRKIIVRHILDTGLLLLLAALPFYWALLQNASEKSGMDDFWVGVRYQTADATDGNEFGLFARVRYFSTVLALIALNEFDGKRQRWRPVALILVSMIYLVFSMGRFDAVMLIFSLLGVYWIRSNRINARSALLVGVLVLVLFVTVGVVLEKGGSTTATFSENLLLMYQNIQLYALGGIVAFDRYVAGVVPIETGLTFRFFTALAKVFNANIHVPSLTQAWTNTPTPTNVYTDYFPYYSDFGSLGVMVIMFALGGTATLVYLAARRGHPLSVILYGHLFACLFLTNFSYPFLTSLSTWLQLIVITWAIYSVPLTLFFPKGSSSPTADSSGGTPPGKSFLSGHRQQIEDKQAGSSS